jgi:glycogen phosphorylase
MSNQKFWPDPDTPRPEGLDALADLAFDLRFSSTDRADALWSEIDPELWRETHNAWLVLRAASHERVRELWSTPRFRELADAILRERRAALSEMAWFGREYPSTRLTTVAFFSLEYALSEALPLYSGGLGNVAGDFLKAASDLGLPLVGVGLLYQQGYFRQVVDRDGHQQEFYPFNRATEMPVVPVRDRTGRWVRVSMPRPGPTVWLRAWMSRVGRVTLYLLDSDDPANGPADRAITAQLYGGGDDVRLLQEIALGIGGWRLLRALGLSPEVCHLNEGHAGLVTLERARDFMREGSRCFAVAHAATRAGNVFTTHTPVEAGFDRFAPSLFTAYLGEYANEELGISEQQLLDLGRAHPGDPTEPVNMAWLAARGSGSVNGVSRRHAEVSRRIFQPLFPRWPEVEVPIGHVTNGVHMPSWDSTPADRFWASVCKGDPWLAEQAEVAPQVARSSDADLWAMRAQARSELVGYARERLRQQLAASGIRGPQLESAGNVLDPDVLTIGMARRFTAYKRPTLLLHDPQRLARLLTDDHRPVQLVVAGKAHPRDEEGKRLLNEWVRFVRREDMRPRAVFLADYDLRLAERLVQGVDVWVNTPRPPWEACGTSGMKVLVNGGLNLSSLDGWWAEAYRPLLGWALEGDGRDDDQDARQLYELLETQIAPVFYERDASGLPRRWLALVRASMASLAPRYSATRAMREYTRDYYLPAAQRFLDRAEGAAIHARGLVDWEHEVRDHWNALRMGEISVKTEGERHRFVVPVYLDGLRPDAVAVELFADGEPPTPMRRDAPLLGAHGFTYVGEVSSKRASDHYTPRIIPTHPGARVPLELPLTLWAR